ncbi:Uncharacterised protein [Vibrio cholerae]|nr:Uncharacterised protein [Vibrio cholerae]
MTECFEFEFIAGVFLNFKRATTYHRNNLSFMKLAVIQLTDRLNGVFHARYHPCKSRIWAL